MVGYWLGKAYWGRGIASSALALFLDDERHRPLLATVAAHNVGSRRVLEKAGFEFDSSKLVDDGPELGTITLLQFRLG
jgi:RimJ/RimL family protein N-acetyltransferase